MNFYAAASSSSRRMIGSGHVRRSSSRRDSSFDTTPQRGGSCTSRTMTTTIPCRDVNVSCHRHGYRIQKHSRSRPVSSLCLRSKSNSTSIRSSSNNRSHRKQLDTQRFSSLALEARLLTTDLASSSAGVAKTASSSSSYSSSSGDGAHAATSSISALEVALSSLLALCASATLVLAFPSKSTGSKTTTFEASNRSHQKLLPGGRDDLSADDATSLVFGRLGNHSVASLDLSSIGGGSSSSSGFGTSGLGFPSGGCGGGGGGEDGTTAYASLLYAAAPATTAETNVEKEEPAGSARRVEREENTNRHPARRREGKDGCDISVRAIKGGRVTMEDEYYVADGGRFVGVFDGHGGGGVSNFLKRRLYAYNRQFLKQKHWEEEDKEALAAGHNRPSLSSQVGALRQAFQHVEREVMEDDTLGYQGSTAVVVVLHESDEGHRTLLSANVGDSRAILSRAGKAIDLTTDHKPNEPREKARILSMGDTIEWDRFAKVHRVRNLSLSRAIGDRYAKPIVSGEVEIKHFPVEESDEFILLASDGLWDVMTSEDVVSFVHGRLESEALRVGDSEGTSEGFQFVLRREMAKYVAREAIRRGTGDNVCVVMVWLNDLKDGSS